MTTQQPLRAVRLTRCRLCRRRRWCVDGTCRRCTANRDDAAMTRWIRGLRRARPDDQPDPQRQTGGPT